MIAAPPLTPRERAVLALLCEGLTQKQIAAELGVSVRRVEQVLAVLRLKAHVASNVAMAIVWREQAS